MLINDFALAGGKKIILLTGVVDKNDIEVHFKYTNPLDGNPGLLKGNFSPNDVHSKTAIVLTTPVFPVYLFPKVDITIDAQMYLFKKAGRISSEPVPFYFHPNVERTETKEENPFSFTDFILNATIPINAEERKPVKRDRHAMNENVSQDQPSTGQITVPPRRCKSGEGNESGCTENPTLN